MYVFIYIYIYYRAHYLDGYMFACVWVPEVSRHCWPADSFEEWLHSGADTHGVGQRPTISVAMGGTTNIHLCGCTDSWRVVTTP